MTSRGRRGGESKARRPIYSFPEIRSNQNTRGEKRNTHGGRAKGLMFLVRVGKKFLPMPGSTA